MKKFLISCIAVILLASAFVTCTYEYKNPVLTNADAKDLGDPFIIVGVVLIFAGLLVFFKNRTFKNIF